ncbi:xanthine dehydrogenase accessory protein XdhC [Chromatiales bacterium (ex Bugula neritina AB1)]|nr:xanthine dehydrogenase accessory protein XdhC [Chromatiales bacterium (ex Bugula neritina AB1)]
MPDWINNLIAMLRADAAVTLVTVVRVDGSVPREVGARMLVSQQNVSGTIGGGNLEYQAIAIARDRLLSSAAVERRMFALGPALGQCCGGKVELLFEQAVAGMDWVSGILQSLSQDHASQELWPHGQWLCRCVEAGAAGNYEIVGKESIGVSGPAQSLSAASSQPQLVSHDGLLWFCEPLFIQLPQVWLFGAGHVGKAVVAQLALLPCRLTWIDERAEMLQLPESLEAEPSIVIHETEACADEVAEAPSQACYVIMTHSHATDYDICQAVIDRGDFRYLGVIGSDSKRRQFTRRLQHRNRPETLIKSMRCPIGLGSIRSRRPESIALSLAMQLSVLWEQTD